MKIQTRQFGPMDFDEAKIYTMPYGMPGFPGMKRFAIIEDKQIWPFGCFQSVDDPELSFYIMNPYVFKADYAVDLDYAAREVGWGEDAEAIKIYVIVNTSAGVPEKITANLLGPLLLHTNRYEAVQFVLHDGRYSHQTPVFQASAAAEKQNVSVG